MSSVLTGGARTALGRRVVARLAAAGVPVSLHEATGALIGPDVAVHLGPGDQDALAEGGGDTLADVTTVLDHATSAGIHHLVVLSSAMVYGAWPNNPVPLTEDAPVRPDPSFEYAHQLGQVEQRVDDWRRQQPGRTVTVLRPVLSLAADGTSSVVRALAAGMGQRFGEEDAPAQFLHLDDLAQAVEVAVLRRLDGVYNVAPDGWVAGERVRALAGHRPRLTLPPRLAEVTAAWRWRFQRGPIPPGLRPYTWYPWLVANDRLKAEGWRPTVTNEQAYVEGTEARWWTMLTPKRKQELALAGMVASLLGLVWVVVSMIRRARRAARAATTAESRAPR